MNRQIVKSGFTIHPSQFDQLFTPDEDRVLGAIVHVNNWNNNPNISGWKRYVKSDWFKRTHVGKFSFKNAIEKLKQMEIVFENKKIGQGGGFIDYTVNFGNYNRLVEIVENIKSDQGLLEFRERFMVDPVFTIDEILAEDLSYFSNQKDPNFNVANIEPMEINNEQSCANNGQMEANIRPIDANNEPMGANIRQMESDRFVRMEQLLNQILVNGSAHSAKVEPMVDYFNSHLSNNGPMEANNEPMIGLILDQWTAKNSPLYNNKRIEEKKEVTQEIKTAKTLAAIGGERRSSDEEPNLASLESDDSENFEDDPFEAINKLSDQNKKFVGRVVEEFKNEYKSGERVKHKELSVFFQQRKEEHLQAIPELAELTREDIFPFFKSRGANMIIYWEEFIEPTEEEITKAFLSLSVSENRDLELIKLSDDEKCKIIIEDFRTTFPYSEQFPYSEMQEYISSYMRDLELQKFRGMLYDDNRIVTVVCPEINIDQETKLYFRKPAKLSPANCEAVGDNFLTILPESHQGAENASESIVIFREKLKDFKKRPEMKRVRIPVLESGKPDCRQILPVALNVLGYADGDYIAENDLDDILDAISELYPDKKIEPKGTEAWGGLIRIYDRTNPRMKERMLLLHHNVTE